MERKRDIQADSERKQWDRQIPDQLNAISGDIIDAAIRVHTHLGPGLLENSYEACLKHELIKRGHHVRSQVALPITYDGIKLDAGYRLDLLVDRLVVVEIKAIESLTEIHTAQVMTYLRHSQLRLGLLLNFNVMKLTKGGLKRIAL